MPWFETVYDLNRDAEALRRRRYGVIEVNDERLARICLRPWPKIPLWAEARLWGRWRHQRRAGKVCRLYYNESRAPEKFITLAYVESSRDAGLATFRLALTVLDEIARLKQSDFLVTDVANHRISNRLLRRWGWAELSTRKLHRLYIKRFYGSYPSPGATLGDLYRSDTALPGAA